MKNKHDFMDIFSPSMICAQMCFLIQKVMEKGVQLCDWVDPLPMLGMVISPLIGNILIMGI